MIRAYNVDPASPLRYKEFSTVISSTAAITNAAVFGVWGYDQRKPRKQGTISYLAKVVDVIVAQSYVGVGGTSQTIALAIDGTTICSTAPVVALAATGSLDCLSELTTVPSGWTRGMLKTDSSILLKKGSVLSYTTTVSGTYSTAPNIIVTVVVDPYPV